MKEWVRFRRTKWKAIAALLGAFSVEEVRQIALALLAACDMETEEESCYDKAGQVREVQRKRLPAGEGDGADRRQPLRQREGALHSVSEDGADYGGPGEEGI